MCKNLIEAFLNIHEKIQKSRALGTNKQVSPSSIYKYNLLRKADTLLGSLYYPWKVSRILRVQELRHRKCIRHRKKVHYYKLERKRQSTMASARPIRTRFQDSPLKLRNKNKSLKLGGDAGECPVFPPKINFWQQRSKLTQKQISKFSGVVQFLIDFLTFCKTFCH